MKPSEKWAYLSEFTVDDIDDTAEPLLATQDLLKEVAQLEAENEALGELLSSLVDIELERDKLKDENDALKTKLGESVCWDSATKADDDD